MKKQCVVFVSKGRSVFHTEDFWLVLTNFPVWEFEEFGYRDNSENSIFIVFKYLDPF